MTIYIAEKGRKVLCLWLPLSLIKSKAVLRLLCNSVDGDSVKRNARELSVSENIRDVTDHSESSDGNFEQSADVCNRVQQRADIFDSLSRQQIIAIFRAFRNTIKMCGHFDLVHVESADGDSVHIRL